MRPVVSYDDIAAPQNDAPTQLGPPLPSTNQPPAKKRRTSPQKASQKRVQQHWDDPGTNAQVIDYGVNVSGSAADEMDYEEEEEESRELTQEDIWDDSALIEAWNSATAEYEAYHGKNKDWKSEPVKKSSLWYNIPPPPQKETNGKTPAATALKATAEENTGPIDFDTFVPTHDPSLAGATQPALPVGSEPDYAHYLAPNSLHSTVGQDEAFAKALSATYWAGYWTAVYHSHSNQQINASTDAAEELVDDVDGEGGVEDDSADLVSTQR
ncbi:hypothetical protein BC835DRAFT_1406691 [Cytidiella melzeri]|nr:hypothetical protein BC835DRAFT_1406691 [Cytidiella melzeri]